MTLRTMLKRPSALIPLAMSILALTLVLIHVVVFGVDHEADDRIGLFLNGHGTAPLGCLQ